MTLTLMGLAHDRLAPRVTRKRWTIGELKSIVIAVKKSVKWTEVLLFQPAKEGGNV